MSHEVPQRTRHMLIRHEGLKLKVYKDTVGVSTIGVGRNLDANGIRKIEAEFMLDNDIQDTLAMLQKRTWFGQLDAPRQGAMIDFHFQLGERKFARRSAMFTRTIAAIARGDYEAAARHMLDSKWAKQVPSRAREVASIVRTGEWAESEARMEVAPEPTGQPAQLAPATQLIVVHQIMDIACVNESSVSQAEFEAGMKAIQKHLDRDFTPAYGIALKLHIVPKGEKPPVGMALVVLADNSDTAGAAGWHDVRADGSPLGKAFVNQSGAHGWTSVMAHELHEIGLNEGICEVVDFGDHMMAKESDDPVQGEELDFDVDGVWVSDFVLPAYWQPWRKINSVQFDFRGAIGKPGEIAANGYAITNSGGNWDQRFANRPIYGKLPGKGSRRERFMRAWNKPRRDGIPVTWMTSTAA